MKFFRYVTSILLLLFAGSAYANSYNYISPDEVKADLSSSRVLLILDIQVEDEFTEHHLPGSVATYAFPVKSDTDRAKLNKVVAVQKETNQKVVIVCPRGKGGAKRSYDFMKENGVSEEKLVILEKGMSGWPYKDIVITKAAL